MFVNGFRISPEDGPTCPAPEPVHCEWTGSTRGRPLHFPSPRRGGVRELDPQGARHAARGPQARPPRGSLERRPRSPPARRVRARVQAALAVPHTQGARSAAGRTVPRPRGPRRLHGGHLRRVERHRARHAPRRRPRPLRRPPPRHQADDPRPGGSGGDEAATGAAALRPHPRRGGGARALPALGQRPSRPPRGLQAGAHPPVLAQRPAPQIRHLAPSGGRPDRPHRPGDGSRRHAHGRACLRSPRSERSSPENHGLRGRSGCVTGVSDRVDSHGLSGPSGRPAPRR